MIGVFRSHLNGLHWNDMGPVPGGPVVQQWLEHPGVLPYLAALGAGLALLAPLTGVAVDRLDARAARVAACVLADLAAARAVSTVLAQRPAGGRPPEIRPMGPRRTLPTR
ncbi:MAG: hypothetical protein ACK50I_25385 [Burkholderiales bacterium]|jgi:hypothetical protein